VAETFEAPVEGGILRGERDGTGEPALVLHGGPGLSDYTQPLAAELSEDFATIRYQQRGLEPGPLTGASVEAHVADAIAVLDVLGVERAWVIGHSWGGYLAMHVAAAYPERLAALVAVCPLGAVGDGGMAEFGARMDERFREHYGRDPSEDETFETVWPLYFPRPHEAPSYPEIAQFDAAETWASIGGHNDRQTLERELPSYDGPALFVHSREDPLPWQVAARSAELIAGARLELLDGLGHFPWLEEPGCIVEAVRTFRSAGA
jgi:pimeloyl-ACP methyl ester carboxylesterase